MNTIKSAPLKGNKQAITRCINLQIWNEMSSKKHTQLPPTIATLYPLAGFNEQIELHCLWPWGWYICRVDMIVSVTVKTYLRLCNLLMIVVLIICMVSHHLCLLKYILLSILSFVKLFCVATVGVSVIQI